MGGACGMYGGRIEMCTGLSGKTEGKKTLGTATYRWQDNFKMHLNEIILAQDTTT